MKQEKMIPYGVSNFQDIRSQEYLYVDKTRYVEILESYGEKYIVFLRPRRFGKSLFVSMLDSYYDVQAKDAFDQLFAGLYIGEHPTVYANRYYILRLDFSGMDTSSRERLLSGFTSKLLVGLKKFCKRYSLDLNYNIEGMPAEILEDFLVEVEDQICGKIYVLIDEYDHFANELLSFQVDVFEETISKTGFVRKWYEVLKSGTALGIIDRIFITGVSPVTLDSLTSGFNIASNVTRDQNLNEMMGFTGEEVADLLRTLVEEPAVFDNIMPSLKQFYNGYLFSPKAQQRVYNSDMVLYYLNSYKKTNNPPEDLVDTNISSDYSKMQKLFTLKNQERNYQILERILRDEPQITSITREYSLAKEFTEEDFLSLLFYLGFLTIDRPVLNMVYLKVPNYAIRELYFHFFAQILKQYNDPELDTLAIRKSILELATKGSIAELVGLVENLLGKMSNRDYVRFDEKYIKFVILTYLSLSKVYYVKSEYEANGGFVDIAFFSRNSEQDLFEGLIELKYIKKEEYDKKGEQIVDVLLEKGKNQLLQYATACELHAKPKLLKFVLVFAGDQCVGRLQV